MELRHLRYFEMVATELSFRRAAERLRVAQPALSRQIKNLEDELTVELLARDTTRVRLTDAGRVFLEQVRHILGAAERASQLARDAAAGRYGRLTVGNIGPITAAFMPATLTAFRAHFPQVDVTLAEIEPAEQISAVDAERIQVGFTVETDPVLPPQVRALAIRRSPMCAVIGSGHRLARRKRLPLRELCAEKMLCFAGQRSQTHSDLVRVIFSRHKLTCPPVLIVTGFESLLAMIASGQGISLMPQHIVVSPRGGARVIELEETGDELIFTISAIWRETTASSLAAQFVRQLAACTEHRPKAGT